MVISMTGFGRSRIESGGHTVIVEMKTVNHRFSELNIRMPRQLMKLEDKIKKQLSTFINRGKIDLFIDISGGGLIHKNLHIDWGLIEDYHQLVNKVKDTYSLKGDIALSDLLGRGEFVTVEETEEENAELDELVMEAVLKASDELRKMRVEEGKALHSDFLIHLDQIRICLDELSAHAPAVTLQYRERLRKRIREWSEGDPDEARLLSEVAIFADKSDITEELTRLGSHLQYFHATLNQDGVMGRKLDFIIQEMNREVNTIGSKANDSSISTLVVELKSALEKVREQVQNVE
ncbi:YicC/YloC family endoribonuclease [Rossellomorea marisflavi]|uniref:YicC/YloC family endoribonuclease n=1 Tax=Rossellomorea marisflavi TaxID=189381 RepID=UPI0034579ED8